MVDPSASVLLCHTYIIGGFVRPQTDKELNFDVETAIRVCRQANFHLHALYLAKKFEQHEWYLKIQLEDVNNYTEALEYISKLSVDEVCDEMHVATSRRRGVLSSSAHCACSAAIQAERNLMQYGKTLLNFLPEQTTALLKKLCTEGGTVSAGTWSRISSPSRMNVS